MTVIRPNSITGITSITAQANEINVFRHNGVLAGLQLNGVNHHTSAGVSTFHTVNVLGNLDVAGVLTYQDVTNVDSLGIGTFRTGINVSGGQLDVGSNIKLGNAGVVTATSFVGSGANLTSLPAQVTINNASGNRVITSDGGTTLNGEANLTFDGTTLTTNGSGGINISASGSDLTMNSAGAIFTGNGGNATDPIVANGSDTNTGYFYPTADTLAFTTGGSERLRMDSSGRVMIGDTNTNNAFSGGDSLVIGNTPSGTRSGITLVSNSSTDGGIYFSTGSSNQTMGQVVYNHPDNSLRFYANNSQRLRIKNDGSVAIAGDNVNISTDTSHTVSLNEKVAIKNRYVDCGSTEINLDTSGTAGQSLNLVSHSSATNHYAVLTFDSGSLKSAISGGRPNAGNWGTELRFYTHPSTTSNVHKTYERMRIHQDGEISLNYGRVTDAGHKIYRYGGRIAGTATVSVNIPVYSDGNIYWIEAFYTHHSLSYGGYLYGVYGAYSGHNGLQINNTIGSSTAGGSNVGTWSVSRGNAGQPVVIAKSAGSYSGQGHWWVHVHAGTTPNI